MSSKENKFIAGFTIVELLIALAITSMLLTAVVVAFKASTINYQENEDIFKTINNARQALLRMTRQIRTGDNFNPVDPSNRCSFFTANNEDITYEYRSADNKLYLITNSNSSEYVLCNNVTSMSFTKDPTDDGTDVKSVQIAMTVVSGDVQRTISAATVVRRNLN
ncbi:MAG: prepilin-type N-terminal cleavage/methylation domain-containing protein [Planctomycetota bacterium]|nr:MAG: prepilin-type N-terminal cleavage/methylation domain-containing protein [Planctomycetota bacterium]